MVTRKGLHAPQHNYIVDWGGRGVVVGVGGLFLFPHLSVKCNVAAQVLCIHFVQQNIFGILTEMT